MAYGIMRIEKRNRQAVGGLQVEADRTEEDRERKHFVGSDINWDRTAENVRLVSSDHWWTDIKQEIADAGITTIRKNAVVMLDGLYTASPDFFEGKSRDDVIKYFMHCLAYHKHEYGHIISAVIHFDEATPHLHICSVPITKDGRLSAKEIMGNRTVYHKRQDRYFDLVSQEYGLERGTIKDHAHNREHIEQMAYKAQQAEERARQAEERVAELEQQVEQTEERAVRAEKRAMRAEEVKAVEVPRPHSGKVRVDYDTFTRLKTTAEHVHRANDIVHNHNLIVAQAQIKAERVIQQAQHELETARIQSRQIVQDARSEAEEIHSRAYRDKLPELTELTNENKALRAQIEQFNDFLKQYSLVEIFREFLERVKEKAKSLGHSR